MTTLAPRRQQLRGLLARVKGYLPFVGLIILLLATYRSEPVGTGVAAIVFAVIMVCTRFQIYFISLEAKRAAFAKAKARHGILLDQPHHTDKILKSGYYRIP